MAISTGSSDHATYSQVSVASTMGRRRADRRRGERLRAGGFSAGRLRAGGFSLGRLRPVRWSPRSPVEGFSGKGRIM
ncbi:hypothetical protein GCM10022226_18540 [Sphaerisporangium flaviroseum]|uniref:Uncharacterized protein n=1 Tax=Sphaerisporangium flaviroseum TaxID=509199 RepID=A0ABP7HP44_9ACTN